MTLPVPKRDELGRLLPGHTAAPSGKKRARRVPREVIREAVSDDDLVKMLETASQKALSGDDIWLGWFLSRMYGTARPESAPIKIDGLDTSNPAATARSLIDAVGKGEASSSQVKDIVDSLKSLQELEAVLSLGAEIEELKATLAGHS